MLSSNWLTTHEFSDGKLVSKQAEMTQSQIGNNNNMLFHLPPVWRTHDQIALVPYQKYETLFSSVLL